MVWASDFMILVRGDGCELEEIQGSQGQGGRKLVFLLRGYISSQGLKVQGLSL